MNAGSISLTCLDTPEGSGCGTLINSGTITNTGTITGYSDSITESCVATLSGNQPPAGAIRFLPCAPVITSPSGTVSIAGGTTVSGTDNLAGNGGSPVTVYISYGCFLCNDLLAFTTTSSTGAWSVFVPLSPGTYSLYGVAYTCSGGSQPGLLRLRVRVLGLYLDNRDGRPRPGPDDLSVRHRRGLEQQHVHLRGAVHFRVGGLADNRLGDDLRELCYRQAHERRNPDHPGGRRQSGDRH